jgi:hypothetical protein
MSNQFLSFASIPQLSRFTGSLFLKEFSKLNQTCAQHSHTNKQTPTEGTGLEIEEPILLYPALPWETLRGVSQ